MKLETWRFFLQNQETMAGSVFVLAATLLLWWFMLVRGRRSEKWINGLSVLLFWAVAGGALWLNW